MSDQRSYLDVDIELANKIKIPVWTEASGVPAFWLGWGNVAPNNLALRKRLGRMGAPFGALGWFDPQKNLEEATDKEPGAPPADLDLERVKRLKIDHFELCANGAADKSMYLWTLQIIYDVKDHAISAEILIRVRNGSDSAPFEDVVALMNPAEPEDVRKVYAKWKVAEIVDFTLYALKTYPELQKLRNIYSNVRPLDMPTDDMVFKELVARIEKLPAEDVKLLKEKVIIEVTEDQKHPDGFEKILEEWKKAFGFKLSYDDAIGTKASEALQKKGEATFHTPEALYPLMSFFDWIKVDIEWAGYLIFLSHPSYATRAEPKAKVLEHVKEKGTVLIPKGPAFLETELTHDKLCEELVEMCKATIDAGKKICIELTVRPDDPNNAYAIEKLKGMGVDLYGEHQDSFLIQGGLTGAKAFTPEALATCIRRDAKASAEKEKPAADAPPEGKDEAKASSTSAEKEKPAADAPPEGKASAASAEKPAAEEAKPKDDKFFEDFKPT